MANQVKIVFAADESAVLRSQKAIIAGEQKTADAMKQTARAAEQAERTTTAAKNRAARSTDTGWIPGTHGVSPLVLNPAIRQSRAAMAARVTAAIARNRQAELAAGIASQKVDLNTPELQAFDQSFRMQQSRRALLAVRENRMLADAKFRGIDPTDESAIHFNRWQRAQSIRAGRMAERVQISGGLRSSIAEKNAEMSAMRSAQTMESFSETISTVGKAAGLATGAIAALAAIMQRIEAERQGAVARTTAGAKSMRDLRQLATSQSHLDSLTADVGKFREAFGIDESAAAQAVFDMESSGLRNDQSFDVLKQAHRVGISASLSARMMQLVKTNYGYAGGLDPLLSKAMIAAGPSMANIDQIAGAVGQSAGAWQSIGGKMDEQFAMLGVMSNAYKSTDVASERVASLAAQINKDRSRIKWKKGEQQLGGLDLVYALPRLAQEGRLRSIGGKKQTVDEWLGEVQAIDAFKKVMANRGDIDALTRSIGSVGSGSDSLLQQRSRFKIGATDAVDLLAGSTQLHDLSIEAAESELTAYRDAILKRKRAADRATSPIWTNTLGALGTYADSFGAAVDSAAFDSPTLARYAPVGSLPAIWNTLAMRRTQAENIPKLRSTVERLESSYTPADMKAVYSQEFNVAGGVIAGRAAGDMGLAIGNQAVASLSGNPESIAAAAASLAAAAQALEKITKLQERKARIK